MDDVPWKLPQLFYFSPSRIYVTAPALPIMLGNVLKIVRNKMAVNGGPFISTIRYLVLLVPPRLGHLAPTSEVAGGLTVPF
jgi:hypothetical protein